MALVFISHSSKDKKKIEKYSEYMKKFGIKSTFLDFDDENGLEINEEWEKRLYKKLRNSK